MNEKEEAAAASNDGSRPGLKAGDVIFFGASKKLKIRKILKENIGPRFSYFEVETTCRGCQFAPTKPCPGHKAFLLEYDHMIKRWKYLGKVEDPFYPNATDQKEPDA